MSHLRREIGTEAIVSRAVEDRGAA
jgi:hypothetical protein